ncbi:MAG: glycerophosphodiester phosphodiesterase [Arcobacter sp.]|uniref:glycerophosphodiester phosphodiesterase n=1 Tax=Arcobacter sp. TaxID=1872629 RepID=UPI003B002B2D
MNFFDRFEKDKLLIAHRGYSAKFPENTKIAFENALTYADIIEFDIILTKDKKVVAIHDEILTRTSNVCEIYENRDSYLVYDFIYDELLSLDFSAWFDKDIPLQKIMLLDEVLEFSKEHNIPLNIEIKDMKETSFDKICIFEIYKIINRHKMADKVLISSFNHIYLEQIKQINKNISIAALFEKTNEYNLLRYLKYLDVDAYHINSSLIEEDKIKKLIAENIYTNVYTINDKKLSKKLFEIGIKAVFTDTNLNIKYNN